MAYGATNNKSAGLSDSATLVVGEAHAALPLQPSNLQFSSALLRYISMRGLWVGVLIGLASCAKTTVPPPYALDDAAQAAQRASEAIQSSGQAHANPSDSQQGDHQGEGHPQ